MILWRKELASSMNWKAWHMSRWTPGHLWGGFCPARMEAFLSGFHVEVCITHLYFIFDFNTESIILWKKENLGSDTLGWKSCSECLSMQFDFSEEIEVIFRADDRFGPFHPRLTEPCCGKFEANPVTKHDMKYIWDLVKTSTENRMVY